MSNEKIDTDTDDELSEQEKVIQHQKQVFHTSQKQLLDTLNEDGRVNRKTELNSLLAGVESVCETVNKRREWENKDITSLRDELIELIRTEYDSEHVEKFDTEEYRVWEVGMFGAVELLRQFAEWKHYDNPSEVVDDFVSICNDNLLSLREKYAARLYRRDGTNIGVVEEGERAADTEVILPEEAYGTSLDN